MKDPAVLFYTKDFLTGTAYFSDAERGQYIRLLCEQHQNGHIPENHMVSVCLSLGSPVVKKFVLDVNGDYYNVRMDEEIEKRRQFTESRRINGIKGGRPKEEKKPLGIPLGLPTENLVADANGIVIKSNKRSKKVFIPPTVDEMIIYFRDNGYNKDHALKVFKYYSEGDWHDSNGNQVNNWKQKCQAVWFKNENRINGKQLQKVMP